ncbi:MAG: hypothetical protein RMJ56_03690, partial [Gemmataceae bacterium]|nr:hypothetical protein [Gemmata sp.]MDW8196691.1 hypothetical protein [Gemmataceae bacterium]
ATDCCDPCAGIPVTPATPTPHSGTTPPKEMPKPKDKEETPKPKDKKEGSEVVLPTPPILATSPY